MCGIFGVIASEKTKVKAEEIKDLTAELFKLSESRGKEAAGLAIMVSGRPVVIKESLAASQMIKTANYMQLINTHIIENRKEPLFLMGHSRMPTNGRQAVNSNNQPVIKNTTLAIHNGIITNEKELWSKVKNISRETDLDTESFLSYFLEGAEQKNKTKALSDVFKVMKGTASVALTGADWGDLLLATNNGSLYYFYDEQLSIFIFASESYILNTALEKALSLHELKSKAQWIRSRTGLRVTFSDLKVQKFDFDHELNDGPLVKSNKSILNHSMAETKDIQDIKRCTKCVLPDTVPFIEFDEVGVCNFCREYEKMKVKGKEALLREIEPYRKGNGDPDCLVMLSGGRDSTFGLHYVKNELGMNPVTYTYDWGMVTDLARRNQARICGQIGAEHILVSADIPTKRANVRMNVEAWLKKPDLGMVPIFMAGDKQYFYYIQRIKKETGINLIFVSESPLERTRFKSGFCGVKETGGRIYNVGALNKFKMLSYYAKQYLLNPSYINKSFFDTLFAYFSAYGVKHDFLYLFDYIPWVEKEVSQTIIQEYEWETDPNYQSTWRIGDGTAAFYNYIYYTVAGFTENDTLRSNQIREGHLTREEALKLVNIENQPRWESLEWYAKTIGFDLDRAIGIINRMPKLYQKSRADFF